MNFSNINTNLYKSFIAVYENKHMRKAAEQIHITQSTIWHNVRELERQLGGVQLFIAHPKGVEPTPEANALYEKVHKAFGIIHSGESDIARPHKDSRLVLRIGCPAMITNTLLLDYIIDFIKLYPDVKLEIHEKPQAELVEMLARCNLDVLVHMGTIADTSAFQCTLLKKMQHTFFASTDFVATYNLPNTISREHLQTLPVILFRNTFTQELLEKLQININPVFEAYTSATMYHMVYKGVGIGYTIKDFFAGSYANQRIVQFDCEAQLPTTDLVAACNKNNESKIVQTFLKELKEFLT